MPLIDDTLALLTLLHRGGAYAYFHALPDRRSWWYPTDDPLLPPKYCKLGQNWYFGVHPTTAIPAKNAYGVPQKPEYVRSQKAYIAAINCLYGEYDAKHYGSKQAIYDHLAAVPYPMPSVIIDSGGGLHCYWLLQTPFILENDDRREAARIIQQLWVQTIGADPTVHDLTRVLRIPGTLNYKYDPPPFVDFTRCDLEHRFTLRDLTKHLPAVEEEPPPRYKPAHQSSSISEYNRDQDIGDLLEDYGYKRHGRWRMTSPWSGSGRDGVSIDTDRNRVFVHTGGDPLCDGYWKRPFDVYRILGHGGDFDKAIKALRKHA